MPKVSNGTALDSHFADAWGMVAEVERRFILGERPGAIRLRGFVNRAHMGSYRAAVDDVARPADIRATREYRQKYGVGLNLEQEVVKNVGTFVRLGWSDGQTEGWTFADVDRTATAGISIKGEAWHRPNDTFAIAVAMNGASRVHQQFLAAGGTGILAGDGGLSYAMERLLETYYDFLVFRGTHASLDYQFITNPAFNRDRGPVSVVSARLHWTY